MHGAVPWQGLICPAEEEDKEGLKAMKLFWSMRCLLAARVGSGPAASSVTKSRREGTVLSYQYRLEHEGIDNSPAVKDLRESVDNDLAMCTCSSKSQMGPGLHQNQHSRLREGGSSPVFCSGEAPAAVLCPALDPTT